jgi:DNA invertase Pin-like site-specific DNA recombinase
MKTETKPRLRLIAYYRLSTAGQLDGFGPEVYEQTMRKWARANKHTIVELLSDDAVSGTVDEDERPALLKAIEMVAEGKADGILFPDMTRLARHLQVQEGALAVIWAHGGRVFAVDHGEHLPDDDDDPMRTLLRQFVGAVGQFDRTSIAKRLRNGRAAKKAAGGYAGGAPAYGVKAEGGALVEDDAEAAGLRRAQQLKAEGASLRAIAATLNEEGVPTKRGGRWSASTVSRLLDPAVRAAYNANQAARRGRTRAETKLRKAAKITARLTA